MYAHYLKYNCELQILQSTFKGLNSLKQLKLIIHTPQELLVNMNIWFIQRPS